MLRCFQYLILSVYVCVIVVDLFIKASFLCIGSSEELHKSVGILQLGLIWHIFSLIFCSIVLYIMMPQIRLRTWDEMEIRNEN